MEDMTTQPAREVELFGVASWVLQGTGPQKLRLACAASQQPYRELVTHHAALLLAGVHPARADGGHAHPRRHLRFTIIIAGMCCHTE